MRSLETVIDRLPGTRMPALHARLTEICFQEYTEADDKVMDKIEQFFLALHTRGQRAQLQAIAGQPRGRTLVAHATVDGFKPRSYEHCVNSLRAKGLLQQGDTIPRDRVPKLREEIKSVLGSIVWQREARFDGSYWCLLLTSCVRCDLLRVHCQAYAIDALAAPDVAGAAIAGKLNRCACARCGEVITAPGSILIDERDP